RNGGDLLPPAVLEADDERLVDVEVDPVPGSAGAIDGQSPPVVREDGLELAVVGAVRLDARAAEKLDHRAAPVILAAHRGVAGNAPDDVAVERRADLLRVVAECSEDAAREGRVRMLADVCHARASPPSVATTASAITFNGRCETWLARRSRANASCSDSCSF